MNHYPGILAGLMVLTVASTVRGSEVTIQSGPAPVALVELYTSEGCSSCPPAEAWFSRLKNDPALWKTFVPIAFHVNYWDNLGWPDKYASAAFTDRQRNYAAEWKSDRVYTPELVSQGLEGSMYSLPKAVSGDAGRLRATLNDKRELMVSYTPAMAGVDWQVHVALLGCDLQTAVKAGENNGETLKHDFVVLAMQSNPLKENEAHLTLGTAKPGEKAFAVWVTEGDRMTPVQVAGGWLK
ncbi:MAG TPA: DUF1223 domain-containing protein [Verrucomicrobiae bacterium]|jgi:hypothetical protein|nr:DUF1223 domain-containing protein [Verrucomicrobiae bacterium]